MVIRTFNCTQQELYTVCRLGWQSCSQHLTGFFDFKAKYDANLITIRLAEVEAASKLPDEQARGSISETFRIQLTKLAADCLSNWQKLKRYIADAFPPEFQKTKLEAAGQSYYHKAGNDDWEACRALLTSSYSFIIDNEAILSNNQNMPGTFPGIFQTAKKEFEIKHQDFLDSEEKGLQNTETKSLANNEIHKTLMPMFLDGQEIFKDEDALKKQFIFDQVLNLASGTGTAGIRGTITDAGTNAPIPNATINIESINKSTTTDEEGKYIITQVASGKYKVIFTAQLYQQKSILQEIKVGTISTANQQLAKI